jgi:deoxyribodipyrimidine photo-lyase
MSKGLFLFRRDFRYEDNTSLIALAEKVQIIYPIFNYDPVQADPKLNKWFSEKAFRFMQECIADMDPPLIITKNDIITSLQSLKKKYEFTYLGFNSDYTEFSAMRDANILSWCKDNDVIAIVKDDIRLLSNPPLTKQLTNYRIFTPFYKKHITMHDSIKINTRDVRDFIYKKENINNKIISLRRDDSIMKGGRSQIIFHVISDDTGMIGINMSPYLKFGCISIREIYNKYKNNNYVVRQLIWRDFYYGLEMTKEYSKKLPVAHNPKLFGLWARGETDCPIVNAGMRQLNQTGTMPNRIRLIVASYLVKDLQLDWQLGEHYFATKLIDYDPLINNGNWAWIAGINNRSSQRPMIKFSPDAQQKKYDPKMEYINKWT